VHLAYQNARSRPAGSLESEKQQVGAGKQQPGTRQAGSLSQSGWGQAAGQKACRTCASGGVTGPGSSLGRCHPRQQWASVDNDEPHTVGPQSAGQRPWPCEQPVHLDGSRALLAEGHTADLQAVARDHVTAKQSRPRIEDRLAAVPRVTPVNSPWQQQRRAGLWIIVDDLAGTQPVGRILGGVQPTGNAPGKAWQQHDRGKHSQHGQQNSGGRHSPGGAPCSLGTPQTPMALDLPGQRTQQQPYGQYCLSGPTALRATLPNVLPTRHLLAFVLLSYALIVVPGPNVLFVVSRSLQLGRLKGIAAVVGGQLGVYVQVIAVAFGIGALVERSVVVFTVIKLAGAIYLIFLGVQAIRHRKSLAAALGTDQPAEASTGRMLRDGFIVGIGNPKAIVFFAAVLPQFADRSAGHVPLQLLLLGAVFMGIALVSDSMWAMAAGTARTWFAKSPKRLARIGGAGGLVMIGIGASLALTGRSD
jgi:threonine/homoserine/homoserine lactone efflux protein